MAGNIIKMNKSFVVHRLNVGGPGPPFNDNITKILIKLSH